MYNHQNSGSMPLPVVSSSTNLNQQQPQALPGSVPVPPYYVNQHIVSQPSVPVVPMNHWQQQSQTLPMQAIAMPWSPVYQGMPVADQYQAPSAGPSSQARIQRTRRFRQAGSQYTSNHYRHASSGTIEEDRSTGINPGYGWISANKEAGVGQALSTSDEPTRDEVDPSIYEVTTLIASEQSKGTARDQAIPIPTPSTPSAQPISIETVSLQNKLANPGPQQPFEEDDLDTISLGSD